MRHTHEEHVLWASNNQNQQNTYNKLNKDIPKPYSNVIFFSKTQQKHKIQEIKGLKHEILWENKKTHTLFLKIGEEMMKKMEV